MSFKTVYDVLTTRLSTVTGLPTLQKENIRTNLGSGKTAWCRATILPARTKIQTIGPNGFNEDNGLLQVDLFYPADAGYGDSFNMLDSIQNKFVAGTILSNVIIQNTYPVSGQTVQTSATVPNYYMVSLMIEWSLFSQRPTIV